MKQRTILGILLSSAILLTACAPGKSNDDAPTNNSVPTAVREAEASVPVTDIPSSTEPEMDSSLACAAGQTFANTTVELTEGPYYTPNTSERASL